jgi:hypothetical protein
MVSIKAINKKTWGCDTTIHQLMRTNALTTVRASAPAPAHPKEGEVLVNPALGNRISPPQLLAQAMAVAAAVAFSWHGFSLLTSVVLGHCNFGKLR